MVETITSDVCGSRRRQRAALRVLHSGRAGRVRVRGCPARARRIARGGPWALPVAALLALVGAAREGGFAPVPLPQSRRQVPEPWRFRLPLPVWAAGYGAGLGLGFLTYQPVATFWVACAAAVALGRPVAGAMCFAAYGAGRIARCSCCRFAEAGRPRHRRGARRPPAGRSPRQCGCIARLRRALWRLPQPAPGPMPLGPGSQLDPSSAIGRAFAYTQRDSGVSSVVVRPVGRSRGSPVSGGRISEPRR